jgi:hypothetical protein
MMFVVDRDFCWQNDWNCAVEAGINTSSVVSFLLLGTVVTLIVVQVLFTDIVPVQEWIRAVSDGGSQWLHVLWYKTLLPITYQDPVLRYHKRQLQNSLMYYGEQCPHVGLVDHLELLVCLSEISADS